MLSANDFENELWRMMRDAQRDGNAFVDIEAGELHRRVGGYPGTDHRMPICCRVMRAQHALDYGDVVLNEPASGQGASLSIRYKLPRFEKVEFN